MTEKMVILCADAYGKEFFKTLLARLKEAKLIPNLSIALDRFYGPCNTKLERQMKVFAHLRQIDAFIIFVDADGKPQIDIIREIECHVDCEFKASTKIIVFQYEIEDWLCISKGICIRDDKPAAILRQREGYEKYRLPEYAPKLDIRKLIKDCRNFCEFLEFVQSFS